jgi:ribonuclease P protein component
MLPSGLRVRGDRNFSILGRFGIRIKSKYLDAVYIKSENNKSTSFAINVTKRIYKQAVKRNRAKRCLWSVVAREYKKFPPIGYLILFRVKSGFITLSQSEMENIVIDISTKIS